MWTWSARSLYVSLKKATKREGSKVPRDPDKVNGPYKDRVGKDKAVKGKAAKGQVVTDPAVTVRVVTDQVGTGPVAKGKAVIVATGRHVQTRKGRDRQGANARTGRDLRVSAANGQGYKASQVLTAQARPELKGRRGNNLRADRTGTRRTSADQMMVLTRLQMGIVRKDRDRQGKGETARDRHVVSDQQARDNQGVNGRITATSQEVKDLTGKARKGGNEMVTGRKATRENNALHARMSHQRRIKPGQIFWTPMAL